MKFSLVGRGKDPNVSPASTVIEGTALPPFESNVTVYWSLDHCATNVIFDVTTVLELTEEPPELHPLNV